MEKQWSISPGLDLHADLDRGDLRRSLETVLRDAIRSGRLPVGARLPATRTLAADLGVARGTVSFAYEQLVAEGYLTARQGSGTRVAAFVSPAGPAITQPAGGDAERGRAGHFGGRRSRVRAPGKHGLPTRPAGTSFQGCRICRRFRAAPG